MKSPRVSLYTCVKDTKGVIVSIDSVIDRIKSGDSRKAYRINNQSVQMTLQEVTEQCNILAQTDKDTYAELKEQLDGVTWAGSFQTRNAKNLIQHSALIPLDVDGLTPGQIADLLAELAQMPHVVLAFVSPSGTGIKVLVRVDPTPHNDHEHKGAYQACLDFFDNLTIEYGFKIDTSGKDCSRLCFLAHEHHPIVNTTAPAIPWNSEAYLKAEKEKHVRFEADAKKPYTGSVDIKALDHIDPNDLGLQPVAFGDHSG